MAAMPVLKPLHDEAGLERLVVSTYQAVSGAGSPAARSCRAGAAAAATEAPLLVHDGSSVEFPEPAKFARTDRVQRDPARGLDRRRRLRRDRRGAEAPQREPQDPRLPDLLVAGTCVRVPVFTGHSLSINAEFARPITPERATELLGDAPGVDAVRRADAAAGRRQDPSYVGRIRQDPAVDGEHGLALFVSNDNLRKGAALNAVQIAELVAATL